VVKVITKLFSFFWGGEGRGKMWWARGAHSKPEISLSRKPNQHCNGMFFPIPDTHGIRAHP